MAKALKGKRGRPPSAVPGIVYRLTITLHPKRDAAIIARIEAAGPGRVSSTVVDLMRNGVGSLPAMVSQPEIESTVEVDHEPVAADF